MVKYRQTIGKMGGGVEENFRTNDFIEVDG